ncbi:MAG: fibronectin type III domain-containing protein [Syntrophomonadaceae bacterium]
MQKVRATFSSCLAVLIIGVLAGYAVMLLPQYAEGETISSSPTITIGSPAQQPVRIDANSSSEAITIRVNGVPYTYYTTVSKSTPSPALKPLVTAPKVPTGLRVVSIGDGQLDVAWNKNSESDLKHYRLAYKPAGGSYKSVFTTGTSYSLTGLENGKKYTLKVKAISNSGAESNYCSFVYATPKAIVPSVPKGLKVVSVGDGQLDVAWNKNSESDLKHYRLAYKPAGGSYKSVFTTGTSYSLTGLENGKKYTLKVKAISNSGAESSYCSFVYATPKAIVPSVPKGLKVVSVGDGQLDVAWNKNSESDLKHYRLAYKPAGGSYKSVFTTGTSYSLTGLENGKKYTLKVKAISNSGAESSYCSFVYATPVNSSPSPSESKVEVKTLAPGTKYATPLYVINSGKPGPVVMVVGGVHGNEKAGYTAARKITEYQISRGTLLVLPEANQLAIKAGRRAASGYSDLNRSFPQTSSQAPKTALSRAIFNAIKEHKVDWLIDLHEGYDYYKNSNTSSVGQTLIYYPANSTRTTAQAIVNDLNKGIKTSNQKFTLLRYPVKGSLARAAGEYLGVRAMIFETCSKPALSTRVNYQTQAVNKLLNTLNMR